MLEAMRTRLAGTRKTEGWTRAATFMLATLSAVISSRPNHTFQLMMGAMRTRLAGTRKTEGWSLALFLGLHSDLGLRIVTFPYANPPILFFEVSMSLSLCCWFGVAFSAASQPNHTFQLMPGAMRTRLAGTRKTEGWTRAATFMLARTSDSFVNHT
jgi:hypothetical protein